LRHARLTVFTSTDQSRLLTAWSQNRHKARPLWDAGLYALVSASTGTESPTATSAAPGLPELNHRWVCVAAGLPDAPGSPADDLAGGDAISQGGKATAIGVGRSLMAMRSSPVNTRRPSSGSSQSVARSTCTTMTADYLP
jgi:hypothetical protein